MTIHNSTLETKLNKIINEGKPKSITINGQKIYLSKKKIDDVKKLEKEGGIFPLIPILAAIGAAGSVAGGSAAIANAVNSKNSADAKLEQQKAHDEEVEKLLRGNGLYLPEYQKGNGFSEGIKAFADKSGLKDEYSKLLRTALKPLSEKLNVIVKGNGLILFPK